jgi:hypothetical protein
MQHDKKTRAIEKFREGCTWEEVANAVGVARTTLWRWSRTDEEFASAIKDAKADPDLEVEAVTFMNACDPDPAHNTLRMFWLNSRLGYKHRSDVTSNVGKSVFFIERAHNPRDRDLPNDVDAAREELGYGPNDTVFVFPEKDEPPDVNENPRD